MKSHIKWDGSSKSMHWDENNMMKGIIVDEFHLQHYVYDAGGARIIKSKGELQQANVDGETIYEDAFINSTTVYPNRFLTVSPSGRYTKHYYVGSERIMSRLMGNVNVPTGGLDGGATLRQNRDRLHLSQEAGIPEITILPPTTESEDCTQYQTGSEAHKQCICETDPINCASNVMYVVHEA